MRVTLLALLAIAALAFAGRAPSPPSACTAVDCLSCTTLPGCQWCINMQKCYVNTTDVCDECTLSGPTSQYQCPQKLCSAYTDCGSCTSDEGCGWCGDNNKCFQSGGCPDCLPGGASCRLWKAGGTGNSNCSASAPCDTHTDCESCNSDPSCGWCGASLTCQLGSSDMDCQGLCQGCFTQQSIDECPYNHTHCSAYTDCYNCVSQPSCGWCPTSLRCTESDEFGQCNGECDNCFVTTGSTEDCPAPGKQCSNYTDCASCTGQPNCGWCPTTSRCVPGNEFGQCSGSCESCFQFGDDADCPAVGTTCSDYSDCASCTVQPGCGWCPTSNECVFGTEFGQCAGSCEACWQFGDDASCPAAHTSCANYTDCAGCTQQPGCGWCPVNNICVPGTEDGQCTGSCPACYQFGEDADCPAPHTTCADYSDCYSCTQQNGCGWCPTSGTCMDGTEFGQCKGTCSDCWQYGADALCPAPHTSCANYTDCASCTNQNGCGWCVSSSQCVPATEYAPCAGLSTCTACFKSSSDDCPTSGSCTDFNSQSSCQSQSGCVWCTNSNTCQWGDSFSTCSGVQCTQS